MTKQFRIILIDEPPEPPPTSSTTLELLDGEENQPTPTENQPEVEHF